GPRRRSLGHVNVQRVYRGDARFAWPWPRSANARRICAGLRSTGIFCSHVARAHARQLSRDRFDVESGCGHAAWTVAWNGWARPGTERSAVHFRLIDLAIRHRPRPHGYGLVRNFRSFSFDGIENYVQLD